jgi:hypothetical protein
VATTLIVGGVDGVAATKKFLEATATFGQVSCPYRIVRQANAPLIPPSFAALGLLLFLLQELGQGLQIHGADQSRLLVASGITDMSMSPRMSSPSTEDQRPCLTIDANS